MEFLICCLFVIIFVAPFHIRMRVERVYKKRTGNLPEGSLFDSILIACMTVCPLLIEIVISDFQNPLFSLWGFGVMGTAVVTSRWGVEK